VDTEAILTLLQEVAAEVITPRFQALANDEIHEKNPGDLVTIADREAEVLITAALQAAFPDAVMLGEEAYAEDRSIMERFMAADHAFTVDPVDGTKNFVNGSPDHAVMASEIIDGRVQRAWIWQPQHQRAYVAVRGHGAWCNGEAMQVKGAASPLRGVTSRRKWLHRTLGDLAPLQLTWISCGIDYPHLIEGDADFIVYIGTNAWDHAPGSLLLEEAGGYVGTFDGFAYTPVDGLPGIIAAADEATYSLVQALVAADV